MRKASFLFLVMLLLSLGTADFCSAQQNPSDLDPEVRRWEMDVGNGQSWPISPPEGRMLKPGETNTISGIIKDDFLVNDDATGGGDQNFPAVAMDASGDFVICWNDCRGGIYAQRYGSSGDTVGTNFKVNDDTYMRYKWSSPSVAMDADGNFVICWKDYRNYQHHYRHDNTDIYAQRYSNSGDTLGANFRVNDNAWSSEQRYPSIAMDTDGNFVICWQNNRHGVYSYDIYAQQYGSLGDTRGANFRANDDVGWKSQDYPSIATDASGDFVICWRDERNRGANDGNSDIYAQRHDRSGEALGANFRVNDDSTRGYQGSPSIAMDADGNFVICWKDRRSPRGIYAQRFNSLGEALGRNFRVSDDSLITYHYWPSVAMNADGNFVICWEDERNGEDNLDIYAQRYSSSGDRLGANFGVCDSVGTIGRYSHPPCIAMDANGDFVICWHDNRNSRWSYYGYSNPDIYAQRYSILVTD